MAVILLLGILLINRVSTRTAITELPPEIGGIALTDAPVAIFTLQIRRADADAAASAGNNLNADEGAASNNQDVHENFQAIRSLRNEMEKKNQIGNEENVDLPSSTDRKVIYNGGIFPLNEKDKTNTGQVMPLVWNGCVETRHKENYGNTVKYEENTHVDDNIHIQGNKDIGNLWNKRNVGLNDTTTFKSWLQKYNNLKNSKSEERRQQKLDFPFPKKNTETTLQTVTETASSTVHVIPITRNVFKEQVPSTTANINVTENNIIAGYTEDWFESKDRTKIRFSELPQRETYLIPTLKLEEGFYPFSFMSRFFYLIYPFDFPIGLIKDIVWGEFTFPHSFLQSIKVESTFLVCIVVFACIALVIPSYLLVLGILSLFSKSSCDDETEAGALFPDIEEPDCNDKALVVMTFFAVLVCCCACADVVSWMSTAARQLYHSLVPPIDLVLHAYEDDLKNVETLLGESIQQAVASESGIDLVFDSLADIITETEDLSAKISSLRDVSIKAGVLASAASDRIKDLVKQLETLKKYCTVKDMPLCDTLNSHSLEMKMKFDMILHEQQLLELRKLGVENLTRAISISRQEFRSIPSVVSAQTLIARQAVLKDIETRRQEVHNSAKIVNNIVRDLTARLHSMAKQIDRSLERIHKYEFGRWIIMLACILMFSLVMALILMAVVCGCGQAKNHAQRTLKVSTVLLCFISLLLWSVVSAIFLASGHAEVYVCHALWDSPQYETLTALFDRPSPLLSNREGIFDALFNNIDNVTMDISVKDVIRDCEKDRPAYVVFQLDKLLDVNKETSYFEWEELQADLSGLASAIDVGFLKTISFDFIKLLNEMLVVSGVDFAKYRMDYNVPMVGKDLPSLVDQLENVAAQVTDLTTAGRLETLTTRTQRLYINNIKPLEEMRADIVFKLTELELQLKPFRKKLNISLSHIHTAQYYIDNQGDVIAQKKVSTFVSRLISHAAGWRTHVLMSTGKHAAKCRPLFTVYSALRSLICSHYVASLHAWWVCGFLLGLIWCIAVTPLCVKLWRFYSRKIRTHETMILTSLGQQETPTTALCDGSNWNTPGPPPPPRSDSW
ncbi:prominin-1 [Bombyx mori]|uniref:prominin-1 n=1 Tax=Bombyx mori TaxID=7091 RepID=UPI002ED1556D